MRIQYCVDHELVVFGSVVDVELCPGGSTMQLTRENRSRFVDLYTDYILNTSIADQFAAFK